MKTIRIGILGYGNVGRGAEKAVAAAPDMEMRAIFTRRDPGSIKALNEMTPVFSANDAEKMTGEIDVMLLCGGSATDLIEQGPRYAALFNIVDSYDTHANIPGYLASVDAAARKTTAVISSGWDPGLFSIIRLISGSVLPDGRSYTFWGPGVSQGHSDAIRHVAGVRNAVQYSIPIDGAVESVRSGDRPELTAREKHLRLCYVVAEDGADTGRIENEIKSMPNYFADYDTTVYFISNDEYNANHTKMPHGGMVLHSGSTGGNKQTIEFSLKLDSNPEFTGSILVAYARTAFRMSEEGLYGAKTVFDIPLRYLSGKDREELIAELM